MKYRDQVLAAAAASALYAAACKEERVLWDEHERAHGQALTPAVAARAAQPLLEVCASCPVKPACQAWAEVDGYTGIAAGAAFVNGKRHEIATTASEPVPIAS